MIKKAKNMKNSILKAFISAVAAAVLLTACGKAAEVENEKFTFGDSTGTYSGEWKSGMPHGHGTFSDGRGSVTADWDNGEIAGNATVKSTSEDGLAFEYNGGVGMMDGDIVMSGHGRVVTDQGDMHMEIEGEFAPADSGNMPFTITGDAVMTMVQGDMRLEYTGGIGADLVPDGQGKMVVDMGAEMGNMKMEFEGEIRYSVPYNGTGKYVDGEGNEIEFTAVNGEMVQ